MKDRFNDARSNLYPREMMMDVDTRSHGDRRLDVSSTPCRPLATRVGYWLHLARAID